MTGSREPKSLAIQFPLGEKASQVTRSGVERNKGPQFLPKIQWLDNAAEKHQDHGPTASSLARCGGRSNGEEGHNADWALEGKCTFKISTATDQSKGECQHCAHSGQLHELSSANRDTLNPAKLCSGLSIEARVIHK